MASYPGLYRQTKDLCITTINSNNNNNNNIFIIIIIIIIFCTLGSKDPDG